MGSENIKKTNKDLLALAKKRFDLAVDAERQIREDALEDLRFRAGDQWPEEVRNSRKTEARPCLTINRIPQFVRQVTNDQRQNRPAIRVSPVDDKADKDTAKIFQGLIRHIEYNSNADVAYDTAFEAAVTTGLGYFRVITDYTSPESFEQEILIKRIKNRFSVYVDPYYQEPDGSDMNWGFIFSDISKEEFNEKYKDSELASLDDWQSVGDTAPGWASDDSCRVAEYFHKELQEVELSLIVTPEGEKKTVKKEDIPEGSRVLKVRKTQIPVIKWCKMNAVEVLEETVFPGEWIPIIPVLGDELDVDGVKTLEGIVRHAKDPQRMYNYWATSETETIALAPRAPFIGVEGQFEGHENAWRTANTRSHAYLEYKEKSVSGKLVGAPQRNVFEPPVMAITNARRQSSEDLKATTGIYDASLGARSNENSGVAIQRRNAQSQTNNFHYVDNLSRSMRHLGRILVGIIPKIYDTPRVSRIIGEDGDQEMVKINQLFRKHGELKQYQLSAGKYDVTVDTGPSYATKRQESLDAMLQLTKQYPKVAEVAGDLMVKNMDWPGAQEIAERLKKTMPPELVESADDKDKRNEVPPQVQEQIQQMNGMIEQLTEKLTQAQDTIKTKSIEIDSKERVEYAKMETDLRKELIKAEAKTGHIDQTSTLKEIEQLEAHQNSKGFYQPTSEDDFKFNKSGQGVPEGNAAPPQINQTPTGGPTPGNFTEE